MIESIGSGLVYRNPKPHLRARHTWHPSLVLLGSGELVATFDIGQGAESLDYRTYVARSSDGGASWSEPAPMFEDTASRRTTHSVRVSLMSDGTLVGFGGRFYRDDEELWLVNRDNLGYTEMDLILLRSRDEGRSWDGPQVIEPPLVGPAFETCHPVRELRDGRWLAPTSTWKDWNGEAPSGMKAVALVSHDKGKSWPEYLDVMDQYDRGVTSWEQSLAQLPDGRLLAVIWAFNETTGRTEPTPYALSDDGRTFSAPRPTGFHAQTAKIQPLPDGRILCLYRGEDRPGLWANLSRLDGEQWVNLEEAPLWQGGESGMDGERASGDELSALKFGFPSMIRLPDGDVMAVFWCCEDGINNIRWFRISLH